MRPVVVLLVKKKKKNLSRGTSIKSQNPRDGKEASSSHAHFSLSRVSIRHHLDKPHAHRHHPSPHSCLHSSFPPQDPISYITTHAFLHSHCEKEEREMADIATADGEHPTKRKLDDIKQHEEEELVDNDIAEGGVAGKMAARVTTTLNPGRRRR